MKSRIEQRDDLMTELGLLVDPIRRLIASGDDPRPNMPFIRSQFNQESSKLYANLGSFCTINGLRFEAEIRDIWNTLSGFSVIFDMVRNPDNWGEKAREAFTRQLDTTKTLIRAVPCQDPDTIFLANSPFETYLRLRAICSSVGSRLDLLDAYLDASVFHRYLAEVPPSVPVTLVTSEGNMARNARRAAELIAVSELFAAERPATYRFLVSPSLHDRHLRADSTIYHLGGSIKDAAAKDPFTLSRHASSETDASLDAIIAGAVEWFGPNTPKHRRR